MLFTYQKTVQRLSRDVRQEIINPADLTDYINRARRQTVLESQCIRVMGTLTLTAGTNNYPFSAITLPNAAALGYGGVLNVRQAMIVSFGGGGQQWMRPRGFEWFTLYRLNNAAPQPGQPNEWAQYGQGAAGSIYVDPTPGPPFPYTLNLDTVAWPIALTSDVTPEAIPDFWTDAVPFLTMYLWLLSAQGASSSQADADRMLQIYRDFMGRARIGSTPDVMARQYPQIPSPTTPNIYGTAAQRQGTG